MTKLNSIREQILRLREDAKLAATELFEQESKKLFEEYPTLDAFKWRQYTPYFNDGEPCVFGANTSDFEIKLVGEEDFDEDYFANDKFPKVKNFLYQFNDEDLEAMFGDHVEVIVSRTGVETEDYDHD